ncbi:MAG TPA: hypothetical protein VM845_06100 [Burkholderiaceae bacterium]|jgi:hypothetical protein|nr:hypothetical protein [Burkholderiaceae bacterium]
MNTALPHDPMALVDPAPGTDTPMDVGAACGCECALPYLTGIDVAQPPPEAPRQRVDPMLAAAPLR